MGDHTKWRDLRAKREASPEYRAAYARAGQAHAIGARVRNLREARGLSQAELARRMGTTQSVIARLELGGAEPRFDTLERVARSLDSDLIVELRPREAASGQSVG